MCEERPRHFKLEGKVAVPCSLMEWADQFENTSRFVEQTEFEDLGIKVSTVFLGLDHAWGEGPPILFETMIFGGIFSDHEYQTRCSTWEEAEQMHLDALQAVKDSLT